MECSPFNFSQPSFKFAFTHPLPLAKPLEQSAAAEAWNIEQQPRPALNGPEIDDKNHARESTTKSFEASVLTSERRNPANTKRKRSNHVQDDGSRTSKKKRKTIGRPNNDWTPSRSRKLVRLYLMTDLTIGEIIKVLRARDFAPCKRDVQNQLRLLLQSRPNKIRGRTVFPRARLRLLRECRELQVAHRSQPAQHEKRPRSLTPVQDDTERELEKSNQSMTEWPWRVDQVLDSEGFALVEYQNYREHESLNLANIDDYEKLWVSATERLSPSTTNSITESLLPVRGTGAFQGEASPSMTDIPYLESDRELLPCLTSSSQSSSCPASEILNQQELNTEETSIIGETARNFSRKGRPSYFPRKPNPSPGDTGKARRNSYQSSIHSISELQDRLSSRSESCCEDVWSVMQNLTISDVSSQGYSRSSRRGSTVLSSTLAGFRQGPSLLGDIDEDQPYSSSEPSAKLRIPLPGDLAGSTISTTYYIGLRRYRSSFGQRDHILANEHYRRAFPNYSVELQTFVSAINELQCGGPYEDLDDSDDFGNSLLHVTAALRKPATYLFYLITNGADVHSTNRAGETFLHLLDESIIMDPDPYHSLLSILRGKAFDFTKRDCLGQTPLHLLLQPWMDKSALDRTLVQLSLLDIPVPTSRDSFGRTIMLQLAQAGISEARIKSLFAVKQKMPVFRNYGAQTDIETVADLLIYERHADLLRTICRAGSYPQYEDQAGRNGLHCLAEVSFTLPLPDVPSATSTANGGERREEELQALLKAGVDVNNYDKQGLTPLMAFIIHDRHNENDETTKKHLSELCNAGADVHRRDRQGQSPLHMAVKLGKRTATEFLLSQNANVHARDLQKRGVIALGVEYSKKARRGGDLYAQILLSVDLVAKAGGIAPPTFVQEWSSGEIIHETKESRWSLLPRRSLSLRRRGDFGSGSM
ncbi:hypothetical protein EG329_007102 [Mollisiaceae sp. DMI_Dod_QoI]|nr:hypothetical protein EG329_007102 [Helotiales sp. DMI_Dod_QoI]